MKDTDYGIHRAEVGDDSVESTIVKFGDGMTQISGAGWEKGTWGVQFARINDCPAPFHVNAMDQDVSTLNNIPDMEKVYLVFDNVRSVDALVDQLHDIKERMIKDNIEKEAEQMKITKAECLEFLQTNRINGQKNKHAYGLFVLVEKLGGKWPTYNDMFLNGDFPQLSARAENRILKTIEGYSGREFGRMVWAKNEIKRRENVRNTNAWMDNMHGLINCRCVVVPVISDPKPEIGSSNNIPQRPFLNKVLSEKMKDYIDPSLHSALFTSGSNKGVNVSRFTEAFNKLKAEQEEKKMRDSNAELKEGDKAIVNSDQGFIVPYGAESIIGLEVEIVKFFSQKDIELAAVECNGSVYCFRKSMLEPVKTERQKAIEFYLSQVSVGMVRGIYKANEKYYEFAIESLIDSGYLNTKTPPIAR